MIGQVSRKVPNDRADEIIVKMFCLWIGAYYMIDTRRVFTLVEVPCSSCR